MMNGPLVQKCMLIVLHFNRPTTLRNMPKKTE